MTKSLHIMEKFDNSLFLRVLSTYLVHYLLHYFGNMQKKYLNNRMNFMLVETSVCFSFGNRNWSKSRLWR